MASSYTDLLRLEKQANGENASTWGDKANTVFELIEDAIAGMASINTTGGSTTLTANNSSTDESRMAIIKVSGTLVSNATIVIPSSSRIYWIWNNTSGAYSLTVKTSGGTGAVIPQSTKVVTICDGADCYAPSYAPNSGATIAGLTVTGALDLTASVLSGATPLVFEGGTDNTFETSLVIVDPTADRTLTMPDADVDLTNVRQSTSTLAGFGRMGTNAEQLAGLLADVFCTPAGLASGQLLAANGYKPVPGGLVEQWGSVVVSTDIGAGGLDVAITWPVAFATEAYPPQITPYFFGGGSGRDCIAVVTALSKTGATARVWEQSGVVQPSPWGIYFRVNGK